MTKYIRKRQTISWKSDLCPKNLFYNGFGKYVSYRYFPNNQIIGVKSVPCRYTTVIQFTIKYLC